MLFRSARHTNNLEVIIDFYTKILGMEVVGSFKDHDAYDGVFLAYPDSDWHLEFTSSQKKARHSFDVDDCLVFYPTEKTVYERILTQMDQSGLEQILPEYPYWRTHGICIQDPDGFVIIISSQKVKNK